MAEKLKNKKILIGVAGGIAAFKICELLRLLVKEGAAVRVVMSEAATKFVTPLSFSALGAESVSTDMWDPQRDSLEHISWADWADLFVVAPATANIIAKMAAGIADEALSTHLLAYDGPKLIVPAMNVKMWRNFATQRNVRALKEQGIEFIGPVTGQLASLLTAEGRMAEPAEIFARIESLLGGRPGKPADAGEPRTGDLAGRKLIVTAGPTVEPLDPVRFLSNYSSGKMGYAIAAAASKRGAEVTLVSGPVAIPPPAAVRLVPITTALEMKKAVEIEFGKCDALLMAAAVADFRPKIFSRQKIKKTDKPMSVPLVQNPDIIGGLAGRKGKRMLVGFALETENLEAAARKKLLDKKLDMVIANDPTQKGIEFGSEYNKATILVKGKRPLELGKMLKSELADKILDELSGLWGKKK